MYHARIGGGTRYVLAVSRDVRELRIDIQNKILCHYVSLLHESVGCFGRVIRHTYNATTCTHFTLHNVVS